MRKPIVSMSTLLPGFLGSVLVLYTSIINYIVQNILSIDSVHVEIFMVCIFHGQGIDQDFHV